MMQPFNLMQLASQQRRKYASFHHQLQQTVEKINTVKY
jgi:hypothetical protein